MLSKRITYVAFTENTLISTDKMQIIDRIMIRKTGANLERISFRLFSIYMQRVAVIGGGISGLSVCYYLQRFNPNISVYLFEGGNVGGWIQTTKKNGFIMENGPRSFRFGENAVPLLNICDNIDILRQTVKSVTGSSDSRIYSDGMLLEVIPPGP